MELVLAAFAFLAFRGCTSRCARRRPCAEAGQSAPDPAGLSTGWSPILASLHLGRASEIVTVTSTLLIGAYSVLVCD